MSVPSLSKDMFLMVRNEDEAMGPWGALSYPGKGDRDGETKEPPRRTRISALVTGPPTFLNGDRGASFFDRWLTFGLRSFGRTSIPLHLYMLLCHVLKTFAGLVTHKA